MAEKAGLTTKFTDHSGRKTMMQTLVNQNFPPTDIIQLSGHKNLQSVTHYSTVNESQQMEMSRTLSSVATGNLSHLCNLTTRNSGVSVHSSTKIQKATSEHKVEKQHTMPVAQEIWLPRKFGPPGPNFLGNLARGGHIS